MSVFHKFVNLWSKKGSAPCIKVSVTPLSPHKPNCPSIQRYLQDITFALLLTDYLTPEDLGSTMAAINWAGRTLAHLGLGTGNGQASTQHFGMGIKNQIPSFRDWKWGWKIEFPTVFQMFGIGNWNKKNRNTVFPSQIEKELTKESWEKVGNGNSRSCLMAPIKTIPSWPLP